MYAFLQPSVTVLVSIKNAKIVFLMYMWELKAQLFPSKLLNLLSHSALTL